MRAHVFFFAIASLAALGAARAEDDAGKARIDADVRALEDDLRRADEAFAGVPTATADPAWVVRKLAHMVAKDQRMRGLAMRLFTGDASEDEKAYLRERLAPVWERVDVENTRELKPILEYWGWITIGKFGAKADGDAWLLVQHADRDPEFQKRVLEKLAALYPSGKTSASNYAYLYDRVAVAEKRPQRYGTQMHEVEGRMEPFPLEDPENVDARRKTVGLGTLEEYKKRFGRH